MRSIMQHNFARIPAPQIPRSIFNRSHGHKTTFDAGYLIPILLDEALPGDTFQMHATVMGRLNTPVVPIMDNLFLDTFYFAVPCRILWEHWEEFIGGGPYTVPVVNVKRPVEDTIYDYMGVPYLEGANGYDYNLDLNALPFRAYNLIYNEWFRDQNLCSAVTENEDDGPDAQADYALKKRCKRHDYFTSCLPWPQKGDAVELPLGSAAPVRGTGKGLMLSDGSEISYMGHLNAGSYQYAMQTASTLALGAAMPVTPITAEQKVMGVVDSDLLQSGLYADLGEATAATINELREAFQIQKMLERDARGGTRYVELIKSHFGVESPDFRMQRPEYLGGSSQRIAFNPIAQTSETADTAQGNLAAYAVVHDGSCRWSKSFTEHMYIIGLACVRADLTYQQGLNKIFRRSNRYDFYWPSLAHLGEQEVTRQEIYAKGNPSLDDVIFGYQERYAEYRYNPSRISGKMRTTAATPLDMWHLAQHFSSAPALNQTFIEEAPPMSRVLAIEGEPDIKFDSYFDLRCTRPMPVYSVPGLIDHF